MKKCLIFLEKGYEKFSADLLKTADEMYGESYCSYAVSFDGNVDVAKGRFDQIITVTDERISTYDVYVLAGVLAGLHSTYRFDSILILATHLGRMLAPAFAMKLHTGLVADVTKIGHKQDQIEMIRPAFSGKLLAAIILNFVNGEMFNAVVMMITNFILDKFSWLFTLMAFVCVVLVVMAYFTPFGNVRIGGSKARPVLKQSNYVWIVLCTIMAAGILLWACAEPMYHYYSPPAHVEPETPEAITFLMENIFLEWTFTPMCIYGMPAVLFAFLFYNAKKEYSIGTMLYPAISYDKAKKLSPAVDMFCLLGLVCGMAASMGSAVFLVADGLASLTGGKITSNGATWCIIGVAITAAFVISAVSGVTKGIRILSTLNSRIYMALGIFVFLFGPTVYILSLTLETFGAYVSDFVGISLFMSAADGDGWAYWWPVFYWCNWMAWMAVTSTFLGRISKGYTVKEIIRVCVLFPFLFSVAWLGLFSSSSLYYELNGAGINQAMNEIGTAAATYETLKQMPIPVVTISVFLLIVLISFVTASDSNTNAMSGLCMGGLTVDDQESPTWLKVVWGATIGTMCIIFMLAFRSTDSLKYLSNLGGFPILFLLIGISISFVKVMINPKKYDTFQEDYDENGRPIPSKRREAEEG